MNPYLLAILGLLTVFVAGVISYGLIFKSFLGDHHLVKLTIGRFVVAGAGMYVVALSFIYLFNHFTVDYTGVTKGLLLGFMIALPAVIVPIFADAPYFKSDKAGVEWALIFNWTISFLLLGAVVGALA